MSQAFLLAAGLCDLWASHAVRWGESPLYEGKGVVTGKTLSPSLALIRCHQQDSFVLSERAAGKLGVRWQGAGRGPFECSGRACCDLGCLGGRCSPLCLSCVFSDLVPSGITVMGWELERCLKNHRCSPPPSPNSLVDLRWVRLGSQALGVILTCLGGDPPPTWDWRASPPAGLPASGLVPLFMILGT